MSNVVFGAGYTDITYGFNAYWRRVMLNAETLSDGFEFEIQAAIRAESLGPAHRRGAVLRGTASRWRVEAEPDARRLGDRPHPRERGAPALGHRVPRGRRLLPSTDPPSRRCATAPRPRGGCRRAPIPAVIARDSQRTRPAPQADEPDARPSVTVIVCAYTTERWPELVAAMASIAAQDPAPAQTILVSDHNAELAARARAEFPGVLVVENEQLQGLSGARNTGLAHSESEIVAFLDDDAVALPGWLDALTRAYADPHGGRCRRRGDPRVGGRRAALAPGRVLLGDRLQLDRPARGSGRSAQPHRLQHVVPARGLRRDRRVHARDRTRRQAAGRLRGDRALHPRPPAPTGRGDPLRPGCPCAPQDVGRSRRGGGTSAPVATRKGCRRRSSPDASGSTDGLESERDVRRSARSRVASCAVARTRCTATRWVWRAPARSSRASASPRPGTREGGWRRVVRQRRLPVTAAPIRVW